jgi:hypothetical protein
VRRLPPLPLRRGVQLNPGDDAARCPALRFDGVLVNRCTHRAEPLHDLHSSSGYDLDGEVYGCAWLEHRALPAADPHAEQRAAAERHYGEPVVRLERGGLVLWVPQRIVDEVRARREDRS